jgi:predicted nucleotidyltransferase
MWIFLLLAALRLRLSKSKEVKPRQFWKCCDKLALKWYNNIMRRKGLKLVILFGSRASGKAGKVSDTDVAVLGEHPLTVEEKIEIGDRTAKELNVSEDAIDIVDLWLAPPLLQHEVACSGRLLYGKREDFIRYKVLAWKRYQDTSKFRRARERSLEKLLHAN